MDPHVEEADFDSVLRGRMSNWAFQRVVRESSLQVGQDGRRTIVMNPGRMSVVGPGRMSIDRTSMARVIEPAKDWREALQRRIVVAQVMLATLASGIPQDFIAPFLYRFLTHDLGRGPWAYFVIYSSFSLGKVRVRWHWTVTRVSRDPDS
jgi:hypothetical protein